MRIVLDTNVFISGIFFSGPPYQILKAWRDGRVELLVSPSILEEYQRIGLELALKFRDVDLRPFWDLLAIQAQIVLAPTLLPVIHDDPSDDKFLEAAVAGNASYVISGDKHLLKLSEFQGIQILKPKDFFSETFKVSGHGVKPHLWKKHRCQIYTIHNRAWVNG